MRASADPFNTIPRWMSERSLTRDHGTTRWTRQRRNAVGIAHEHASELCETRSALVDAKVELVDTRNELVDAKNELLDTKNDLADAKNDLADDRERIAGDLRALVIQPLFGESMKLQAAIGGLHDPVATRGRLRSTIAGLDDTIKVLRSAIFALHPRSWIRPASDGRGADRDRRR